MSPLHLRMSGMARPTHDAVNIRGANHGNERHANKRWTLWALWTLTDIFTPNTVRMTSHNSRTIWIGPEDTDKESTMSSAKNNV